MIEAELRRSEGQCTHLAEMNKLSLDKLAKQDHEMESLQKRLAVLERESREQTIDNNQRLQKQELEHKTYLSQYKFCSECDLNFNNFKERGGFR